MLLNAKIATVYAEALLELAMDAGSLEDVEQELNGVTRVVAGDESVWTFFRSPVVDIEAKEKVLETSLKPALSKTLYNFMGVLVRRRRMQELPAIADIFHKLANEKLGRREVFVYSATALTDEQEKALYEAVQSYFHLKVVMETQVREDLIGGLVIRSNDTVFDTSIRSRLRRIKQRLKDRKITGEAYYEN